MAKIIGPAFAAEIEAAGLMGLPFSWGEDGVFGLENLTAQQRTALQAVIAAHDPNKPKPPTPEETRVAGLKTDTGRQQFLTMLQNATPAQIDTWFTNNIQVESITTVAQAKTVMGQLRTAVASMVKLFATTLPSS